MSIEKQELINRNFLSVFNEDSFREVLSEEDFKKYLSAKKEIHIHKGQLLFEEDENPNGVYFIKEGTVKLSKSGVYGKDQILRFIKEGDLIGYRSLLIEENFQAKAEAMSEVTAVFVPGDVFLHMLKVDSQLSFAML